MYTCISLVGHYYNEHCMTKCIHVCSEINICVHDSYMYTYIGYLNYEVILKRNLLLSNSDRIVELVFVEEERRQLTVSTINGLIQQTGIQSRISHRYCCYCCYCCCIVGCSRNTLFRAW